MHIMKTGGTTLIFDIEANFAPHETYPDPRSPDEMEVSKTSFTRLARLSPERLAQIRCFKPHLPFCAADLVGNDAVIITILRDPIERVVSHLKHMKRHVPGCASLQLEQIYDLRYLFRTYFDNHQARLFAVRRDDPIEQFEAEMQRMNWLFKWHDGRFPQRFNALSDAFLDRYGWPFELDTARMDTARTNLERVHVLGLLDRYDELLVTLERDYGLQIARHPRLQVGHTEEVSNEFLARIAEDNQADISFYEYARELYACRRSSASQAAAATRTS